MKDKNLDLFNEDYEKFQPISMEELYDTSYPYGREIIKNLLYSGTYIFAGQPKIGKSFLVMQIAYHIAAGKELWGLEVEQGEVLYLALEDTKNRLQLRLQKMVGEECTRNLFFSTASSKVNGGLFGELESFIETHTNVKLIIVDTLQKIREGQVDKTNYANDYDIMVKLKKFAEKYNICLIIVHHTRKMESEDCFEMISGTNGIMGAVDGAIVLTRKRRLDKVAVMNIVGRDQADQEIKLEFDNEKCCWNFISQSYQVEENEHPLLEKIDKLLDSSLWEGYACELADILDEDVKPNQLTRILNINQSILDNKYNIRIDKKKNNKGLYIKLERIK